MTPPAPWTGSTNIAAIVPAPFATSQVWVGFDG